MSATTDTRPAGDPRVPDTAPRPTLAESIADPAPLGLAAFAMTTFVLSVVNAKLVNVEVAPVVLSLALFYGGIAQFAAGMWEFKRGNTFGALAFTSFGAFWLSFFYFVTFVAGGLAKLGEADTATGVFLLAWTIFTAYMMIASLRVSAAVFGVFFFLFLTFLALTIGAMAANSTWNMVGGWLGLVTAVVAWYASFAGVLNSTFRKTVLPVFPLGR
jgi:succinate-acetate transporter protein